MKLLDPKSTWIFFLNNLIVGFFLVIFASPFGIFLLFEFFSDGVYNASSSPVPTFSAPYVIIAVVLWAGFSFIWAKLTYGTYRYELTDKGFRKESGVIWKQYVTIPYSKIQNVDIYRGIMARLLGLADLHIQTAGMSVPTKMGALSEGRLPGLSMADAEKLRDELVDRAQQA